MAAPWITPRGAEEECCWLPENCFAQEVLTASGRQESKGSASGEKTRTKCVKQLLRTDYNIVHQEKQAARHGDTSHCPSTLESRQEDQGELKASLGYIARHTPISKQMGGLMGMLSTSAFGLVLQRKFCSSKARWQTQGHKDQDSNSGSTSKPHAVGHFNH